MENIQLTMKDHIARIELNRPPVNALSISLLEELNAVLTKVEEDEEVRVLIIYGEGRFFAAGADIREFTTIENGEAFADLARNGQQVFERIEQFSKPIIAAIHGAALGGGLELAMSCHIRLVAKGTKLGLPELQLGLIPGFAGTQRLPRYIGTAKAAEMILSSEPIDAQEAKECGLVNSVHEENELLTEAETLAKKIAKKSTVTVKMVLELLRYNEPSQYKEGVEREAELFGEVFESNDGQEGIHAFLEKRDPQFKNK